MRLSACLLATSLVFAQSSAPPARLVFVDAARLNAASILPSPPANDSSKTLAELAELHRIEQTRTTEEIAHAQADDREESMFAFADVIGPELNRAALPLTAIFSDHVKINESVIVNPAKIFFRRPRPYHVDSTLHPVCKTTEKRDAILVRADDYARSREVCGVHYPSDEEASKAVAYAMIGLMVNDSRFLTEFESARAELRQAIGLAAHVSQ